MHLIMIVNCINWANIDLNNWAASWENRSFAYTKTKAQIRVAVTAKLISAFVFATQIVQLPFFLNAKSLASSHLLSLYSSVCVDPVRKPHCWFSHDAVQICAKQPRLNSIFNQEPKPNTDIIKIVMAS